MVTEKYAKLKDPINLEISRLQKLLTTETGITRADGSFVGPRYTELNNLLTGEKNRLENQINSENAEIQEINNKNYKDYENNEAIRNKTISDLALVIKDVSGWEFEIRRRDIFPDYFDSVVNRIFYLGYFRAYHRQQQRQRSRSQKKGEQTGRRK